MSLSRTSIVVIICGFASPVESVAQQDLRTQFGTDNLDAARATQRGIQESGAGRNKEALAQFREAIRHDPKCGTAYFHVAFTQSELGEIDEGIVTYKKVLAGDLNTGQNIRALSAVNLGLTYRKLDQLDDSNLWFTRGILEDHDNRFKERGKAYRNLAMNLRDQ